MGFLKFLNKKSEESSPKDGQFEVPLPPPKMGGDDNLPNFADEKEADELKLPELPGLEESGSDFPIPKEENEFPVSEEPENKQEQQQEKEEHPQEKAQNELSFPPRQMQEMEMPAMNIPQHEEKEGAYRHTPAEPKRELFPQPRNEPRFRGEVFIRGESYRELIDGLDEIINREKEKEGQQEKDTAKMHEKEHERFEEAIEDVQRNLVVADKTLFE